MIGIATVIIIIKITTVRMYANDVCDNDDNSNITTIIPTNITLKGIS